MSYRFKAKLSSQWVLEKASGAVLPLSEILRLLSAIDATGNISGACKACGISYRHAWGILRNAEHEFEAALIETSRRRGSKLTEFGQHLMWANRRVDARLTPTLESMASELQEELEGLYPQTQPRLSLHASHGFAVEGLMQLANGLDMLPIELRYRTANEALAALNKGDCDVAGFQVPVGEFEPFFLERYFTWLDPKKHRLINLATRNTGLFVQADNPKNIQSIADLIKPEVRFVNRQSGSSTRRLMGMMLAKLGIPVGQVHGYDSVEFTHMAVAAHIASGMADTGIGVETAAWRFGLGFIPLAQERYFLAIHHDAVNSVAMQNFMELMASKEYQAYVSQLVGYDASSVGKVETLQEAFSGIANFPSTSAL